MAEQKIPRKGRESKRERDKRAELLVKETRGFTSLGPTNPQSQNKEKKNPMAASGQRGVCEWISREIG